MYYVYIIRCLDNSLYTGITNNLSKRFLKHKKGVGAKYTKSHPVKRIEIVWSCKNKSLASKLEYHLKRLKKREKEEIVKGVRLSYYLKDIIDGRCYRKVNIKRCSWCNEKNEKYVIYHDEEWGNINYLNEKYLLEMLILESFQAGLSWECILNKREAFREAYDDFDINKIIKYDTLKIKELENNPNIVRNRLKIKASIENSKIFLNIQKEYGTFKNYLEHFMDTKVIYETDKTTNELSDTISKDLYKRGMRFVGSVIIYSYLQALGYINSHEKECFLYKNN